MPASGLPLFSPELSLLTVAVVPFLNYLRFCFSRLIRLICSFSYSHDATDIVDLLLLATFIYVFPWCCCETIFLLCLLAAIILVLLSFIVMSFLLICSGLLQAGCYRRTFKIEILLV